VKVVTCLFLLLGLTACSTDPLLDSPDQPNRPYLPAADMADLQGHVALGQKLETAWWTLFNSGALNDLVHQAVDANPGLSAAKETLAQAQAAVEAEQGSQMPQVSLGAVTGRQLYGVALFGPSNFFIPPFTYYEVGPSFSWTPDLFGGGKHRVERQQALADYQQHQWEALYVALTGNVVAQAVQQATWRTDIDAVEHVIVCDERLRELTQRAVMTGSASRSDLVTAQTRLDTDRALLPALQQNYSLHAHTLAVLLGRGPGDGLPLDVRWEQLKLPAALPVSLPSELVHRRPDILAAEADLHAAGAALGVASANLYPSLTLSANMLQEALSPSRIFYAASNAWALAGAISVPVWDGGVLSAQRRAAEHAYRASLDNYRDTVVRAFGQVADALTALVHDDEAIVIFDDGARTSATALAIARQHVEAGDGNQVDVVQAERADAQMQRQLSDAHAARYLDAIRLFVALGGSPLPPLSSH
jgi:efflux transporter, outer membrane factor (OMF) lipoprotein, NodT family